MLIRIFSLLIALGCASPLLAQSDQQIANYFKRYPDADANSDGTLTREEARAHRQRGRQREQTQSDPTRGDNLATTTNIPGLLIPESTSPVRQVALESEDGIDLTFFYRTPPGKGTYPALFFFHGGGGYSDQQQLRKNLLSGTMHTRFLQAGFTIATATRRPYWKSQHNFESIGFFKAIDDAVLVVETAKSLPDFDAENIVLYGGSGGAMLAMGTASKTDVACVVAGEPATVLLLAELDESRERTDYNAIMADPQAFYQGAFKRKARQLLEAIDSPILILHGDVHALKTINFQIIIPELQSMNKDITSMTFPGLNHGFYWGNTRAGATAETVDTILKEVTAYIVQYTTLELAR